MKWFLVGVVVATTVMSDLLQSHEMKRQGEVRDFRPSALGRFFAAVLQRRMLILAVCCMTVSFVAFLLLLQVSDLSFAVPATAAANVLETLLARLFLREQVRWQRWAGACLVAAGVMLLSL